MKVLIFLFMITAFYGDRYGRNPTWTLRRETIVPIISKEVICFSPLFFLPINFLIKDPIKAFFLNMTILVGGCNWKEQPD